MMHNEGRESQVRQNATPLFVLALLMSLLLFVPVWTHTSDSTSVLGRFSTRYAIFVFVHFLTVVGWLGIVVARRQTQSVIAALPKVALYGSLLLGSVVVTGVMASGLESIIKTVIAANWLLVTTVIVTSLPADDWFGRVAAITTVVMIALLPLLVIAVIAAQGYFPDEAGWAERSRNLFIGEGVYKPTYLERPFLLTPGYGWIVLPYGWTLHNVAFAQATGRVWIFGGNLLMVLGVYALTWRLYGHRAALVSASVAVFSLNAFAVFDFRGRHFLKPASVWITFAIMQARFTEQPTRRYVWDFTAGLLATLAMQIHASAISYPVSLSLLYLGEYAVESFRERRLVNIRPLLAYGIGAGFGTAFYVGANVLLVGGFDVYLAYLAETRFLPGQHASVLRFLQYPSLLELGLFVLAFAYIVWRRHRQDVVLLLWLSLLITTNLFVDKLGYVVMYQALYYIPIGAFFVFALPDWFNARRLGVVWMVLTFILAGQLWSAFLERPLTTVAREGRIPENIYVTMGETVRPLLRDDDVLVTEPDIIWGLPDYHDRIYSYGIYPPSYELLGYDSPDAIWTDLAPTIYIETPLVLLSPELETYLIENDFRLCETFDNLMSVYRPECEGALVGS